MPQAQPDRQAPKRRRTCIIEEDKPLKLNKTDWLKIKGPLELASMPVIRNRGYKNLKIACF